jgi:hypothetical protein
MNQRITVRVKKGAFDTEHRTIQWETVFMPEDYRVSLGTDIMAYGVHERSEAGDLTFYPPHRIDGVSIQPVVEPVQMRSPEPGAEPGAEPGGLT